jgi:hypothetical protein
MVIAPVAASAVVAAVDDEGLVNKLFKIAILLGVLVLATISIIILSWVLDIADLLGAGGSALTATFAKVSLGGIPIIGPIATFITSSFLWGGRK